MAEAAPHNTAERPLVSVIMPSFNTRAFIAEAVASVRAQTYAAWELLVTDDGSTDGSADWLGEQAAQEPRLRLTCWGENQGSARARNEAIGRARGRYVAFLDSDDRWHPEKLARQLAFMQAHSYPFTYTSYQPIGVDGQPLGSVLSAPERLDYAALLKADRIGCVTAMYDTQAFGKVLAPDLRKRNDYGLWLRLLRKLPYAYGLNENLAEYRRRPGSVSANKLSLLRYNWQLYRQEEGLSIPRAMGCLATATLHSLGKRWNI